MHLRATSVSPTRGVWVRYRPRLSGELKPGRSPISTTIARVEQLADFIAESPRALARPAFLQGQGIDMVEHARGGAMHGQRGTPIGDHHCKILPTTMLDAVARARAHIMQRTNCQRADTSIASASAHRRLL